MGPNRLPLSTMKMPMPPGIAVNRGIVTIMAVALGYTIQDGECRPYRGPRGYGNGHGYQQRGHYEQRSLQLNPSGDCFEADDAHELPHLALLVFAKMQD